MSDEDQPQRPRPPDGCIVREGAKRLPPDYGAGIKPPCLLWHKWNPWRWDEIRNMRFKLTGSIGRARLRVCLRCGEKQYQHWLGGIFLPAEMFEDPK